MNLREQDINTNPDLIPINEEERQIIEKALSEAGFESKLKNEKYFTIFFPEHWNHKTCAYIWRTETEWFYPIVEERWWKCLIVGQDGLRFREKLIHTLENLPLYRNDET